MCGQVVPGGSLPFVLCFFVRHRCHTHGLEIQIEEFGSSLIVNEQAIDCLLVSIVVPSGSGCTHADAWMAEQLNIDAMAANFGLDKDCQV